MKKAPATMMLRELKPKEIAGIYPLIHLHNPTITQRIFTARLKDMLPYGYRVVAAFDAKRMVAISGFWLRSRFWCGRQLDIDNFFVHPDYRGSGVGASLTRWLEKRALDEKCELIVLDAYTHSHLAHRFYHRQGFVATGFHFTKIPGSSKPWKSKRPD